MCLCLKDNKSDSFTFSLQWHITAKCDQKCKHCYMYNSDTYKSEVENELPLNECKSIIDDFVYSLNYLKKEGTLVFAGGDPLLREDFFDILKYIDSCRISAIAITGNSYHLDKHIALKLKDHGVSYYQISLDGMKNTHDFLRKPGSFDDAIRGFGVLKEAGIISSCMFTVNKSNMHQIIDVIRLSAELKIDSFDFDRVVPTGSGEKFKNDMIAPLEYKELLIKIDEEFNRLRRNGCKTHFNYRDNLWGLLNNQDSISKNIPLLPPGCELVRGCLIGKAGLVILADGSVMACRRLPVIVGKIPESKIIDILNNSNALTSLKNASENVKCSLSKNNKNCIGCLAEKYCSSDGDLLACDPQCWIKENVLMEPEVV